MISSSKGYAQHCGKLAKEIRNTSKRNKEFKSKQEPKKDQDES